MALGYEYLGVTAGNDVAGVEESGGSTGIHRMQSYILQIVGWGSWENQR